MANSKNFIDLENLKYFWNCIKDYINDNGIINITYSDLKTLRDNSQLVAGQMYRIIDYVTTTTQNETKSANHLFDIIVTALNENTLDEKASAIAHEEDTYFDGNDLSAWELWYDLDNDTDKYKWADTTNGKGVIYRMIDEKRNDCPYDFKNILFYNNKYTKNTTIDKYYFTFSYVVNGVLYDGTVEKQVTYCYNNSMDVHINSKKKSLNKNTFRNIDFIYICRNNTFDNNCYNNTFDNNCYNNTFGYGCSNNTFDKDCGYIKFGYGCSNNKFSNNCSGNTFGNDCCYNIFSGSCYSNTFGSGCSSNTFGSGCSSNTFGSGCSSNTFGYGCSNNTFGNNCDGNTFGYNCYSNTFDGSCSNNTFDTIGGNCYSNTFGYYCNDKYLTLSQTSITLNDEYYDDGSGELVPTKHPDLSTQPSILPYKFMGQYIYEQLIFVGTFDKDNTNINKLILHNDLIHRNVCIIKCEGFGFGNYNKPIGGSTGEFTNLGNMGIPIDLSIKTKIMGGDGDFYITGSIPSGLAENVGGSILGINSIKVYARIIYTIIPEDSDSSYYGNYSY